MIHTVLVSPFFKKEKLYYFFLMHRDVCRLLVLQLGIEPKPLAVEAQSESLLGIQWLGLRAFTAEGLSSTTGRKLRGEANKTKFVNHCRISVLPQQLLCARATN